jgi:ketosteroid isomerase-like protein
MTDIKAIADDFTALCKAGQFDEAGEKYWAPGVVSIEAYPGDMQRAEGVVALKAKGEWWTANHDVHSNECEGPFLNGDQFALIFRMDLTVKATGERNRMDEVAAYTVKDGKIVEERFYY